VSKWLAGMGPPHWRAAAAASLWRAFYPRPSGRGMGGQSRMGLAFSLLGMEIGAFLRLFGSAGTSYPQAPAKCLLLQTTESQNPITYLFHFVSCAFFTLVSCRYIVQDHISIRYLHTCIFLFGWLYPYHPSGVPPHRFGFRMSRSSALPRFPDQRRYLGGRWGAA
jgi:hypothetical protein